MDTVPRWSRFPPLLTLGCLAIAALMPAVYTVAGSLDTRVGLQFVFGGAAVAAIAFAGARTRPTGARAQWFLLGAGLAVFVTAMAGYGTYWLDGSPPPAGSPLELLYLAGYPLVVLSLRAFVKGRDPGRDRRALIDASIVAIAVGVLFVASVHELTTSVGAPSQSEQVFSLIYPALDLSLLALALRTTLYGGRTPTPQRLVVIGIALLVLTDFAYAIASLQGSYDPEQVFNALYISAWLVIAAGALHPYEPIVPPVPEEGGLPMPRFLLLLTAGAVVPAAAAVVEMQMLSLHAGLLICATSAVTILAVVRLKMAADELAEAERVAADVRVDSVERKYQDQLQQQLLRVQKMEALGRLAGGVAHDFNNILAVVMNYARFARERATGLQREDLEQIEAAAERGANLVRQLMAFSRRDVARPDSVDLNELIHGLERMLQSLLGDDVALTLDLDERRCCVFIDQTQLEQVIVNLVVNGRDAMPKGGALTLITRGRVTSGPDSGLFSRLVVSDTGTGISDSDLSHIFDPFFTTKEPGRGTGLGLATVYGVVEGAGGRIQVQSELGLGTSFIIDLPVAAPKDPPAPKTEPGAEVEHSLVGRSILIVEDEEAVRRAAERILESRGWDVMSARDGTEALQILQQREGRIDVVLTDDTMPQMSGRDLISKLRKERAGVKCVLMSGSPDAARSFETTGADAFLAKPFSSDEVLRELRKLFDCEA